MAGGGDALFPQAGYALAVAVATPIDTTFEVYAANGNPLAADPPTEGEASDIPLWCSIESVELERLSVASGSPTTVTMYLCRDEDGDIPLTPATSLGATATIDAGLGTAGLGGCQWPVGIDFHYVPRTGCTKGTLYVALKVDAGSITARVRVNWRGRTRT